MSEKGKKGLSGKGLDKLFRRDNLIILVLSGILLFIIALPTKEGDSNAGADDTRAADLNTTDLGTTDLSASSWGSANTQVAYGTEMEYAVCLEERLEQVLGGVSGVGKVAVMITLSSSEELIVEKDEPMSRSNVNETDSAGGNRTTSQVETNETTIYSTESGASEPYVVMKLLPKVEGVLVVAEGAGSGTINKSISEIIQTLFDLEIHKIKVVKMDSSK